MKQILTTIVLLSLIATTAQAVPVAMQRSGTFTFGTDTPSDWNIMLFFDSDAIQDNQLDSTEVTDFMITTTQGNTLQAATYAPTDLVTSDLWFINFVMGTPFVDQSQVEILDFPTQQEFSYNPAAGQMLENAGNGIARSGDVSSMDSTSDSAGWWTFKQINGPAVPEPVTATLLLAGTLAMTRRRRVA